MNALAVPEVGDYMNRNFVSSFQRVGSFRINGNRKQGGNVASYFCTPGGRVLHIIAGKVGREEFLREARWTVEAWKLALLTANGNFQQAQIAFRKAHLDRLQTDYGADPYHVPLPLLEPPNTTTPVSASVLRRPRGTRGSWNKQAKVHQMLAAYPLVKINRVFELVFERILREDVTTAPVVVRN